MNTPKMSTARRTGWLAGLLGRTSELSRFGSPLRNVAYARAMPTMPYSAQGCRPQWKIVYSRPNWALAGVDGSARSIGGVSRCESGSATPQKMRPMPMPVANIIEIHDIVLNSGRSSSRPRRMRP